MKHVMRALGGLQVFFSSWRFPTLVLSVLVTFKALVLAVLFVPASQTGFGAFAEQFKIWCFGYDPSTGHSEGAYVFLAIAEPLVLGVIIAALWWRPLREIARTRPRATLPYLGSALALVGVAAFSLLQMDRDARAEDLPFPAKSLRTGLRSPVFSLKNQEGAAVSVGDAQGKVVMLTGVYASCGFTCPMILAQAKRAVGALTPAERADLKVLAVTLDPEHDDQAALAAMAKAQGVAAPTWNLLWGAPAEVNAALDALTIGRSKNPETGAIDHANIFVLIDRQGRVAYRLTLGAVQEKWLLEALRVLLGEAPQGS